MRGVGVRDRAGGVRGREAGWVRAIKVRGIRRRERKGERSNEAMRGRVREWRCKGKGRGKEKNIRGR